MSELKANLRRRAKFDVVVIAIILLLGFVVAQQFDFLEWIYQSSRQYEHYELDELVPTLLFGVLAFAYFSYRRWHDVKLLSKYLEEQSLTEPVTHIANRRALFALLEQIAQEEKPQHGFKVQSKNHTPEVGDIIKPDQVVILTWNVHRPQRGIVDFLQAVGNHNDVTA